MPESHSEATGKELMMTVNTMIDAYATTLAQDEAALVQATSVNTRAALRYMIIRKTILRDLRAFLVAEFPPSHTEL